MTPKRMHSQLTDAQLDFALSAETDSIYPSSGFTESVMAAVGRDNPAPAPIPFPWRRAIPGIAAAVAALCLLAAALIAGLRVIQLRPPAPQPMNIQLLSVLHYAPGPGALALALSAAITLAALLLCRRLLSVR